jgi:hypothetical protein
MGKSEDLILTELYIFIHFGECSRLLKKGRGGFIRQLLRSSSVAVADSEAQR